MSKYTPITGELRAAMRQWGWVESDGSITFASSSMPPSIDAEKSLAIIGSDFDRMCDAIDAVHAQLERENADLRMKFVTVNRHAEHVERENESLKAELDRVLGADTWESIIYDAMQAGRTDITVDVTPLIQRCKALCERTKEDA